MGRIDRLSLAAILAVATLAPGPARALSAGPHVEVLGGFVFSKLQGVGSPVVDLKSVHTYAAGVGVRFPLAPTLALEPQVLVVNDGLSLGKFDRTDVLGNVVGTFEYLHVLQRIQVPVLLRFGPPSPVSLKPFAIAGPFVAVRLREYNQLTGDVKSTSTDAVLGSTEFGFTLGAGGEFPLGPLHASLGARYDYGLSGLGDFKDIGTARTGALRLLAGLVF